MNLEKYIGIEYGHNKSSFERADCWGLVRLFYREELGIDLADESYDENWWEAPDSKVYMNLVSKNDGFKLEKQPDKWQFGDVLVFSVLADNGRPNHAGIWIPDGEKVLHVQEDALSVLEPLNRGLCDKLKGAFRHASRL